MERFLVIHFAFTPQQLKSPPFEEASAVSSKAAYSRTWPLPVTQYL